MKVIRYESWWEPLRQRKECNSTGRDVLDKEVVWLEESEVR